MKRDIPDPGFRDDTGAADVELAAALTAYSVDPGRSHQRTLALLRRTRLLVPVIAVPGEMEYDDAGLAHDKTSDMAVVQMRGRDGRLALLGFTSSSSMRAWNPEARPVPVTAVQAASAALSDQATAMVVDVAGPVMFVVEEEDLRALALHE